MTEIRSRGSWNQRPQCLEEISCGADGRHVARSGLRRKNRLVGSFALPAWGLHQFESREFFMCLCQRTTLIGIPPTAWTTFMQSLLSELSMFQDMTMYQWQVVHLVKYGTARYLLLFIVSYNHHMSMIISFAGVLSFLG